MRFIEMLGATTSDVILPHEGPKATHLIMSSFSLTEKAFGFLLNAKPIVDGAWIEALADAAQKSIQSPTKNAFTLPKIDQ